MSTHWHIGIAARALDLRDSLTFEFWIDPDRTTDTWTPIVYKANDAGQRGYSIWYNSAGYIYVSSARGGSNDTLETVGGSVPQGQWTHVAVEIERGSGAMRIYLNGVLATSRTITATPHNGSPDTRSEENTSELQSLMRISYAVFC